MFESKQQLYFMETKWYKKRFVVNPLNNNNNNKEDYIIKVE